jgi:hypothetical protein
MGAKWTESPAWDSFGMYRKDARSRLENPGEGARSHPVTAGCAREPGVSYAMPSQ